MQNVQMTWTDYGEIADDGQCEKAVCSQSMWKYYGLGKGGLTDISDHCFIFSTVDAASIKVGPTSKTALKTVEAVLYRMKKTAYLRSVIYYCFTDIVITTMSAAKAAYCLLLLFLNVKFGGFEIIGSET